MKRTQLLFLFLFLLLLLGTVSAEDSVIFRLNSSLSFNMTPPVMSCMQREILYSNEGLLYVPSPSMVWTYEYNQVFGDYLFFCQTAYNFNDSIRVTPDGTMFLKKNAGVDNAVHQGIRITKILESPLRLTESTSINITCSGFTPGNGDSVIYTSVVFEDPHANYSFRVELNNHVNTLLVEGNGTILNWKQGNCAPFVHKIGVGGVCNTSDSKTYALNLTDLSSWCKESLGISFDEYDYDSVSVRYEMPKINAGFLSGNISLVAIGVNPDPVNAMPSASLNSPKKAYKLSEEGVLNYTWKISATDPENDTLYYGTLSNIEMLRAISFDESAEGGFNHTSTFSGVIFCDIPGWIGFQNLLGLCDPYTRTHDQLNVPQWLSTWKNASTCSYSPGIPSPTDTSAIVPAFNSKSYYYARIYGSRCNTPIMLINFPGTSNVTGGFSLPFDGVGNYSLVVYSRFATEEIKVNTSVSGNHWTFTDGGSSYASITDSVTVLFDLNSLLIYDSAGALILSHSFSDIPSYLSLSVYSGSAGVDNIFIASYNDAINWSSQFVFPKTYRAPGTYQEKFFITDSEHLGTDFIALTGKITVKAFNSADIDSGALGFSRGICQITGADTILENKFLFFAIVVFAVALFFLRNPFAAAALAIFVLWISAVLCLSAPYVVAMTIILSALIALALASRFSV